MRIDDEPWQRATLGAEADVDCWRQWFLPWDAGNGRHDLTVRATDGTGQVQTSETADPYPSGATGLHSIAVSVADQSVRRPATNPRCTPPQRLRRQTMSRTTSCEPVAGALLPVAE